MITLPERFDPEEALTLMDLTERLVRCGFDKELQTPLRDDIAIEDNRRDTMCRQGVDLEKGRRWLGASFMRHASTPCCNKAIP